MSIEFHCEHCGNVVKAPAEGAGRSGRCPHCGGVTYIPSPAAQDGELDMAPLDEDEERRRQKEALEAAALQRSLLHERAMPGEPGGRGTVRKPAAPSPAPASGSKHLSSLIVGYIDAMSTGKLARADELLRELYQHKPQAAALLDEMATENLAAYGLPSLPRPVLMGFLKQLRARL